MGDVLPLKRPPGDNDWVADWAADIARNSLSSPGLPLTPADVDDITRRMQAFAVSIADALRPFDYDTFAGLMLALFHDRIEVEIYLALAEGGIIARER